MAYICHKDFDCEHCDSWRYDEDRMENVCFAEVDEKKAYNEKDYKKMIDLSGMKLGFIADSLKMSRQTLWAKLNGKSAFSEDERMRLETLLCIGPALQRGDFTRDEANEVLGLNVTLETDIIEALNEALNRHGFKIVKV